MTKIQPLLAVLLTVLTPSETVFSVFLRGHLSGVLDKTVKIGVFLVVLEETLLTRV